MSVAFFLDEQVFTECWLHADVVLGAGDSGSDRL